MKLKFIGEAIVIGTQTFTHGMTAEWRESSEHGALVWQVNAGGDFAERSPVWITADKSQWASTDGNATIIEAIADGAGTEYRVTLDDMPDVPVIADYMIGFGSELTVGQRVQANPQHYKISQTF